MEDEISDAMQKLTLAVNSVDDTLAIIIKKHENKYQKQYADFVEQKTKRLNEIVEKLNEKASNRTLKDIKIGELQSIIQKLQKEAAVAEGMNEEKRDDIQKMKTKMD